MDERARFTSIEQFKGAMKEQCLLNRNDVVIRLNNKLRCKVKCKAINCGQLCFVSKMGGCEAYRLKTLIDKHNYVKTMESYLVSFD